MGLGRLGWWPDYSGGGTGGGIAPPAFARGSLVYSMTVYFLRTRSTTDWGMRSVRWGHFPRLGLQITMTPGSSLRNLLMMSSLGFHSFASSRTVYDLSGNGLSGSSLPGNGVSRNDLSPFLSDVAGFPRLGAASALTGAGC